MREPSRHVALESQGREAGGAVRVVYLTDGDGYRDGVKLEEHGKNRKLSSGDYKAYGRRRQREAHEALKMLVKQPFAVTEMNEKYDVRAKLHGGGVAAQAGALRHGISRALCVIDLELRKRLKKAGFLTRDARIKERKKYGQKGARRRFQFSKR